MKIIEPKLSQVAKEIVKKRYLLSDRETPGQMLWRVARHLAKPEINWSGNGVVEEIARKFFERMINFKLVIAGRAMFEAGNPEGTGQLSSCFVLPIEDNIQSIFKTLGDAAVIHKNNGGTGFNFSQIRPGGDKVKNVPGASSGPVDFLLAYSAALSKILQGSKRQGANIGILNCDHPDIEEFIKLKSQDGNLKNFNISVGVTDAFMESVEKDKNWKLKNPRNNQTWKTIKAKKLFELIVRQAWSGGDPGLAFLDRIEKDNPTPSLGKIEATNPCAEIPLLAYESCNLTSIVLSNHLKKRGAKYEIDWSDLEASIKLGVRLLDNMIEVNAYPVPEIEEMVKRGNRKIGLGVMGFAHLLFQLKIAYDSTGTVKLAEQLAKFIRDKAEEASLELGKERGVFDNWDQSIFAKINKRLRNSALTMIAPTGTTSILANTSSGIEPVFSLVTLRRTFFEDDRSNRPTKELVIIDPVFKEFLTAKRFSRRTVKTILEQVAQEGDLKNIGELSFKEKRIFVTTHQIDPKWHLKAQTAWQRHFDNSVSKTINFSSSATVEDIEEAFILAWKLGCKGITIYRDGSKRDQVLNLSERDLKKSLPGRQAGEICPECGNQLVFSEGCASCQNCGWSKCRL